jgi:hypothetical protein
MLRKEIARLRSIVGRAIMEIELAGKDGKARALERALAGR